MLTISVGNRADADPKERYTSMHVSVHHDITDSQKWDQLAQKMTAMVEQGRLPQGMKGLMYLPSADGRKADCLWEAPSVESLRSFLDRETGSAARNDYFPINSAAAFGLPGQQAMRKAA
jgi:hypothetical protein